MYLILIPPLPYLTPRRIKETRKNRVKRIIFSVDAVYAMAHSLHNQILEECCKNHLHFKDKDQITKVKDFLAEDSLQFHVYRPILLIRIIYLT